jgi:hypothetical protein
MPNTPYNIRLPIKLREALQKIADAENDIKKHFRYVSFNSERNPKVNNKGE